MYPSSIPLSSSLSLGFPLYCTLISGRVDRRIEILKPFDRKKSTINQSINVIPGPAPASPNHVTIPT